MLNLIYSVLQQECKQESENLDKGRITGLPPPEKNCHFPWMADSLTHFLFWTLAGLRQEWSTVNNTTQRRHGLLSSGRFRNYQRGGQNSGVWAEPTSWRHIMKITMANIVSCDHCIKLELAILAEWTEVVSMFSLFCPSSSGRRP